MTGWDSTASSFLVTGGAGFIGSHLVDRLVRLGEVTVYDNLSLGRVEFIQRHLSKNEFRFVESDLLDLETLVEVVRGHQVIFHMAANSDLRRSVDDTGLDLRQETLATHNVLEAMRRSEARHLVFASSSAVCGETGSAPVREDYGPLLPISLYGAAKLACEGLISAYCHLFGMRAWVFRFGNVVGSRATHGVLYDFVSKLLRTPSELEVLGDGSQEKSYIHVDDCVEGMLVGSKLAQGQMNVLNLASDSSTPTSTIARMTTEAMGLPEARIRYTGGNRGWPGDVPQFRLDITKMCGLGWAASLTSDQAIRKALTELVPEIAGTNVGGKL
jgi:UDP-glucose 4-epimerase